MSKKNLEDLQKPTVEIEFDTSHFLTNILEKSTVLSSRIDDQLNILLGLSTAIFIFAISKLDTPNNLWAVVLSLFSASSIISGLFAVHPPRFISQVSHSESLLYNKNIARKFKNAREYGDEILKTMQNREAMVHQQATEVYNVYKYYYGPKRKMFKFSRLILVLGIIATGIILMVHGIA